MQRFTERTRVPFSAEQMYRLVAEVEHYSDFLPWCRASRLIERSETAQVAEITVSKGPLRQRFTTRNQLQPVERLGIELVEGPFKSLRGEWRFTAIESGCEVSLSLAFEFSSRLLDMTAGPVFKEVNRAMVDAFVRRATQLYV
ncbi:MAG: type II toxin-antitoxin system RatA family toxin [Pseudomonadota bacterium]